MSRDIIIFCKKALPVRHIGSTGPVVSSRWIFRMFEVFVLTVLPDYGFFNKMTVLPALVDFPS